MRYLHGCRVKSGILERGYPQLFLIITLILTNPFLRRRVFLFNFYVIHKHKVHTSKLQIVILCIQSQVRI